MSHPTFQSIFNLFNSWYICHLFPAVVFQREGVTVTSQILEKQYLEDSDGKTSFQAGKHQYSLYFKDVGGTQEMYQQNIKCTTKREVRRRPRFVSADDVEKLKR